MKAIFKKNAVVIATVMITIIGFTFAALSLTGCSNGSTDGGKGGGSWWKAAANNPLGISNTYASVVNTIAYGNGKFVAGGRDGKMAYSSDGKTWTAVPNSTFGTGVYIHSIAFGNDRFVAGGDGGKTAYSKDGVNWTTGGIVSGSTMFGNTITAIGYGGGKFIAAGTSFAASSTDGTSWSALPTTNLPFSIQSIAYGGGKFVAVGGGSLDGKICYSTDGTSWTNATVNGADTKEVAAVAYGNGKFVTFNFHTQVLYSPDGKTWAAGKNVLAGKTGAGSGSIFGVAYGGNKFVAVGSGSYYNTVYSSDGINWTGVEDNVFRLGIHAIAFGNGTFAAGSEYGELAYSTK